MPYPTHCRAEKWVRFSHGTHPPLHAPVYVLKEGTVYIMRRQRDTHYLYDMRGSMPVNTVVAPTHWAAFGPDPQPLKPGHWLPNGAFGLLAVREAEIIELLADGSLNRTFASVPADRAQPWAMTLPSGRYGATIAPPLWARPILAFPQEVAHGS